MKHRVNPAKMEPTPETYYLKRRAFVRQVGLGTVVLATTGSVPGCDTSTSEADDAALLEPGIAKAGVRAHFPAKRNSRFDLNHPLTDEVVAATHNNFYEFLPGRAGDLWRLTRDMVVDPWVVEITGKCRRPGKFDIDAMFRFDQEERTYRFRCVEAWAMDVPWTGFELSKLLAKVEPLSSAKFVRFVTVNRPQQMPGQRSTQGRYPWPYFEGLSMPEAMHPLTMLVTGVYGRPLPRQHGAPFRIIVPWKYGYKSPKSIAKIELVDHQPATFWQSLQPEEYPFSSNVDPKKPHPRWSQETERVLGTNEQRVTLLYNGYAEQVANLYA